MAGYTSEKCDSATNILEFCKHGIFNELQTVLTNDHNKGINILKRSKDLSRGDFLAIIQSWKSKKSKNRALIPGNSENTKSQNAEKQISDSTDYLTLLSSLSFPQLAPFKAVVCDLTKDNDVLIKLDRTQIYHHVIGRVSSAGDQYGCVDQSGDGGRPRACINLAELMENCDWPGFSVCHLRSMLLSDHVARLLEAVGYNVDFVQYPMKPEWKKSLCEFHIDTDKYESSDASDSDSYESVSAELHEVLRHSRYFEKTKRRSGGDFEMLSPEDAASLNLADICDDNSAEPVSATQHVVNLRTFLRSQELSASYDKNIHFADFSSGCDKLQDLSYLEHHRRKRLKACQLMLHVCPQEKSFYQQTLDVGWQIVASEARFKLNQLHLVHGPVSTREGQLPLFKAADLLELRRNQMQSASILKYGDVVQGAGWETTIQALTVAGIKFELLSTTCRQPVKLDVSDEHEDSGSAIDSRGGVFVMYNCARLANLLTNYDKAVEQGIYPSLPDFESLDFSLLRKEEEWSLVYTFVLPYPSLVAECVSSVCEGGPRRPQIHAHKIAQFLQDLSRDLSSYYSRVHVLGEARQHLFPVMFCRLHLLKAIRQVMCNALQLLGIAPLSQL